MCVGRTRANGAARHRRPLQPPPLRADALRGRARIDSILAGVCLGPAVFLVVVVLEWCAEGVGGEGEERFTGRVQEKKMEKRKDSQRVEEEEEEEEGE